ncbi:hypothetical protein C1645_841644 [Glomus cerebriforme]|uniref:Uncharacterized protein n=1 Tax=Glomus cerebriforme TaxID=658196 RepID=A0A397S3W9_9GLOM|nr:hypothetical protein C1645_841644 [Glomus cerebriforme]
MTRELIIIALTLTLLYFFLLHKPLANKATQVDLERAEQSVQTDLTNSDLSTLQTQLKKYQQTLSKLLSTIVDKEDAERERERERESIYGFGLYNPNPRNFKDVSSAETSESESENNEIKKTMSYQFLILYLEDFKKWLNEDKSRKQGLE